MAYITVATANSIKDWLKINKVVLSKILYKKEIVFLNNKEKEYLLLYKFLCEHSDKIWEYYEKLPPKKDQYKYVFESDNRIPVYHNSRDCPKLHSDFKNYEIPELIKEQWENSIMKYRSFFKEHKGLLENDPSLFLVKVNNLFNLKYQSKEVLYANSWFTEFENLSLEDLENKIDNIIEREKHFFENPDISEYIKKSLKKFRDKSYLYKSKEKITSNNTNESKLTDEDLKKLLQRYDQEYKKPIIKYLREYYRIRFNPELNIEWPILDQLWFKKCHICYPDTI